MIRVIIRNLPPVQEREILDELDPVRDKIFEIKRLINFDRLGLGENKNAKYLFTFADIKALKKTIKLLNNSVSLKGSEEISANFSFSQSFDHQSSLMDKLESTYESRPEFLNFMKAKEERISNVHILEDIYRKPGEVYENEKYEDAESLAKKSALVLDIESGGFNREYKKRNDRKKKRKNRKKRGNQGEFFYEKKKD